uniref:Nerd domain protein n=1 Tax=Eiseniibacteriota bacterium TaxID=2212470 RepID=A0A832I2C5_UNCEI
MPRLHPPEFPVALKSDRSGAAEYEVWEALADELPDEYVVFHRVQWLDRPDDGPPRDGECDLLIAHPARGMLVVEVKGGRIAVDPATGAWRSVDRHGKAHVIDNPFAQANESKHVLRRKLASIPWWRGRPVPIGHAVALPHCAKGGSSIADASLDVTLDAADLTRARASVERVFDFWRLAPDDHWRHNGIAALERLFVHHDFARVPLGVQMRQQEPEFLRLTREQAGVLDVLRQHRRAAISGCAGSGKTMLAVEKARRLAGEGFRVLVTCFNRALADFIRAQLPPPQQARARAGVAAGRGQLDLFGGARVDVESFHALAAAWARRAGVPLPEAHDEEERRRLFDDVLPEALVRAAGELPERYDAVIVDEGQDFKEEWWVALQTLLRDPDHGILYVFYDDNQSLYTGGAALPIQTPPFVLTRNCRNTREIHRWVGRFYRGGAEPEPAGPQGRPPVALRYADERGLREHVRRTLHQLVAEEKVPERDLVVLTPHGRARSALWRDPVFGNLRLTDAWPPAPNHVQWSTVHAFKGLERPVVVLAEVERGGWSRAELLYVGGSRAQSHLVVIEREDAAG